jgi:hypothetical protein
MHAMSGCIDVAVLGEQCHRLVCSWVYSATLPQDIIKNNEADWFIYDSFPRALHWPETCGKTGAVAGGCSFGQVQCKTRTVFRCQQQAGGWRCTCIRRTLLQHHVALPGFHTPHHHTEFCQFRNSTCVQCMRVVVYGRCLGWTYGRKNKVTKWSRAHLEKFLFFLFLGGWGGTETTITEAITGLLYRPLMMDDDECGAIGRMLRKGTEGLQWNLPYCRFVQKPHMTWPGLEPGPPRWEAGD